MTSRSHLPVDGTARAAGILLTLASLLMVVFMAFHPRAHVHGKHDFVEAFAEIATVNALVHGALVALFLLMFYGLSVFTERLGADSPTVKAWARLGELLFAFGIFPLASAAILSGFVVPAYVMQYAEEPAFNLETVQYLVRLVYTVVFTATRIGVVAVSVAILFWAVALFVSHRTMAVAGLLAGGLPLIALASGHLRMDVHGMLAFALAQAAWGITVGQALLRGKI